MLAHLGRRLAILGTLLGVWGWVVRAELNEVNVKVLIKKKSAPRVSAHDAEEYRMFWEGGWEWARLTGVRRIHLARPLTSISQVRPRHAGPCRAEVDRVAVSA